MYIGSSNSYMLQSLYAFPGIGVPPPPLPPFPPRPPFSHTLTSTYSSYPRLFPPGPRPPMRVPPSDTLIIRKIPRDLNSVTKLSGHFEKFGPIVNLTVSACTCTYSLLHVHVHVHVPAQYAIYMYIVHDDGKPGYEVNMLCIVHLVDATWNTCIISIHIHVHVV